MAASGSSVPMMSTIIPGFSPSNSAKAAFFASPFTPVTLTAIFAVES